LTVSDLILTESERSEAASGLDLTKATRQRVSRSGEYILTDNPNYNPNVEQRGDWVEMRPTP
jgi:hypothetical protein